MAVSIYFPAFVTAKRSDRDGYGAGFIAGIAPGIVTVDGVASAAWVFLYDHLLKRIVAGTKAASDGTYRFDQLDTRPNRWAVFAEDFSGEHNMVVRAWVTAALAA